MLYAVVPYVMPLVQNVRRVLYRLIINAYLVRPERTNLAPNVCHVPTGIYLVQAQRHAPHVMTGIRQMKLIPPAIRTPLLLFMQMVATEPHLNKARAFITAHQSCPRQLCQTHRMGTHLINGPLIATSLTPMRPWYVITRTLVCIMAA